MGACLEACCDFIQHGRARPVIKDELVVFATSTDSERDTLIPQTPAIIITAPHTTPPSEPYDHSLHPIDTEAWDNALMLHALLPRSYLVGKPPFWRTEELDPNRHNSIRTLWRRGIMTVMQSGKFSGLIDVHGFPGNELGEDFYFLTHKPDNAIQTAVIARVYALAKAYDLFTAANVAKAGGDNSITDEALKCFECVFLLEIREGLGEQKIKWLLQCMCRAVTEVMSGRAVH